MDKRALLQHIVIYATSYCNAHCSMCDVGVGASGGINKPNDGGPPEFSLQLLEKVLGDELVTSRKIHFAFLMTEPLLAKELPRMLRLCQERGHETKLTTNGFLLEERAQQVIPNLNFLQVSLDGTEDIHDRIRGKDFFSRAIAGIKAARLANSELVIDVNFTVSNLSYTSLLPLMEYFEENSILIDNFKIQLMDFVSAKMLRRHNELHPDLVQDLSSLASEEVNIEQLDIKTLHEQLQKIIKIKWKSIRKVIFKPKLITKESLADYFNSSGEKMAELGDCVIPWSSLAINTNGDCYWHMRCFNDYVLGNVWESSLKEIYFSKKAEQFRIKLAEDNYCFPACTRCCGVAKAQ